MELRLFRYFVVVAEELHFGRAAERLRISQPALSIQIRQLEDSLGGQLFHRANRSVTLTEAGRIFLGEARRTLDQASRAEAIVRRALRGELASVEIGYSASAAFSGILGKAMLALRSTCPDVEVRVHELDPQTQLEHLIERKIHIALMTTLALNIPQQLGVTRIAEWPLHVVVPRDHPFAALKSVSIAQLEHQPFIVYAGSATDDGLSVFRSIASFSPLVAQRATSAMMVVTLVGAGLGVALLPATLADANRKSDVAFRPLKGEQVLMDCSLVFQRVEYEPAVKLALAAVRSTAIA